MVNLKGLNRRPWPISVCYPFLNLERLGKIIMNLMIKVSVFWDVVSGSLVDID
jgi:hypothetical protein